MFKKLFYLVLFLAGAAIFWCAFALWTGIYSIYSVAPSATDPEGATYLVSREEGEPMFNSPEYAPPPVDPAPKQEGMIRFASVPKPKKAVSERTIVKLPYVEWAYKQSLQETKPADAGSK